MAGSDSVFGVEKLNWTNYKSWSRDLRRLLTSKGLFEAVKEERPSEAGEPQKQFDANDEKAAAYICLSVDDSIIYHIRGLTGAKEIWEKLKELFDSPSSFHQVTLIMKLANTKLSSPRFLGEHIDAFMSTMSALRSPGESLPEFAKLGLFMASLPKYYTPIINAWLNEKGMTLQKAVSEIVQYQNARNLQEYNHRTRDPGEELAHLVERDLDIRGSSSSKSMRRKLSNSKARSQQQKRHLKASGKGN